MATDRYGGDGRRPRRGAASRAVGAAGHGSERVLAVTAHAAIGFGFVGIGFLLSLLISGVIWLAGKRSPYVEAHADRAGRYQLFVLFVNILAIALWVVGLGLLLYLSGWHGWNLRGIAAPGGWRALLFWLDALLLLTAVPVFVAWYFGSIVYGLYGALRVLGGHDFHYPPPPWRRRRGALDRPLRWE